MRLIHWKWLAAALMSIAVSADVPAQTSTAEIIEQARARARQVEEIKQILNDPDQNVRLAAFEAMVGSDDSLMRELALDAGLASTDQVLRGMALRHAVLGLSQLNLTLSIDETAPKAIQESARAHLEKSGNNVQLGIDPKSVDLQRGYFHRPGNSTHNGNISGTVLTFSHSSYSGEMLLQDDNTLAGRVHRGAIQFWATAPVR